MKFIKECFYGEIEEKKSKFYAGLFPLEREADVEGLLEACRKKYRDARHHCYAYIFLEEGEGILQEHKKQSDDGEPAKTAGMPILQRMESLEAEFLAVRFLEPEVFHEPILMRQRRYWRRRFFWRELRGGNCNCKSRIPYSESWSTALRNRIFLFWIRLLQKT